jgi:thiamine biosynthesis protein ThiI
MTLFLIRYGEIGLKSAPVRRRMERALARNIRAALQKNKIKSRVTISYSRLFLETSSPKAVAILKNTFGIVSFSPVIACPAGMEEIKSLAISLARKRKFRTFAVKARRTGTHPFTSREINEAVGEAIRKSLKKKVNLSKPDLTLHIEVRDSRAYLYTRKIPGLGGFPLGTQGKIPALIENREDLLAAWLFMRRGCEIIPLTDKKRFLKILEKWSFRKLRPLKKMPEKSPGLVTTKKITIPGIPVYNPLLGLDEKEIKKMLKLIAK